MIGPGAYHLGLHNLLTISNDKLKFLVAASCAYREYPVALRRIVVQRIFGSTVRATDPLPFRPDFFDLFDHMKAPPNAMPAAAIFSSLVLDWGRA